MKLTLAFMLYKMKRLKPISFLGKESFKEKNMTV